MAQPQQAPLLSTSDHREGHPLSPSPSPPRLSSGFKKTFYKRKLPTPPAIEFSGPEGRQLFQEALMGGSMVGFFKLMEQFNTQDEPAFCGLASLAMVLNALSIDPRRTWKGSWRWFHEAMLDCCRPLDQVKEDGITLYQASCLARCNGARVELRAHGSTSLEAFRAEVEAVCSSGEEHIVVSYSRKAFLQTGDGHFSPIGGYHRERDLVLVLDVARFKYPPHWVPLPMLYHAMSYVDPETGRPRGYMRLATNPLLDSVLLTLDVRADGWQRADAFLRAGAPELVRELAARGGLGAEEVVRRLVDAMPLRSLDAFLVARSAAPLTAAAASGLTAAAAAIAPPPASFVCETPEAMAAAAMQATIVGAAAATQAAAASASSPRGHGGSEPSAVSPPWLEAAASAPPAADGPAAATPRTGPSCSSSKAGDSKTGDAAPGAKSCGTAAGGGGACGSGGDGGGCGTSGLMAAATAVFSAQDRCIPLAQRQQLLDELRGMPLYGLVSGHLAARSRRASSADGGGGGGGAGEGGAAGAGRQLPRAASPAPPASQHPQQPGQAHAHPQPHTHQHTHPHQHPHPTAAHPEPPPPSPPLPGKYLAEKVVMALLLQPPEAWPPAGGWADGPGAGAAWGALVGVTGYSVVGAEAAYLREQLAHMDEVLQSWDAPVTCGEHTSRLDCAAHGH